MELILLLLLAYLIGSIPFGLLITKAAGLGDVRKIGSGSIGATNVLRTGSKKLAALTLLTDAGKGGFVLLYIKFTHLIHHPCSMGPRIGCIQPCICYKDSILGFALSETGYLLLIGLAAIIGHCYPIWLKFRGGKGIATAAGVLLAAVPYIGLICCLAWLLAAFTFRISSLSALITAGIAPIVTFFLYGSVPALICTLITLLVFFKHKDNIKRLLSGTEPKIGEKK